MYHAHFQLTEPPFSIAPDPAFLYMSPRHQEALGHLLYGTGQYGGFVQLTGEVGTGKTTLIRMLLSQKLDNVDVAMIHNPRQSEQEFVQTICDELGAPYVREGATLKTLVDALNMHLIARHQVGRRTVLIIDEAQQLAPEVLEQVRLLTNLETSKEKLLRIMLVGQPELAELLARNDLRQLAQRITARYHLTPLLPAETAEYLSHRLKVAGSNASLFTPAAVKALHKYSEGIPRLLNILADRALLGTYAQSLKLVTAETVHAAAAEVRGQPLPARAKQAAPQPPAGPRQPLRLPSFALPKLSLPRINLPAWHWPQLTSKSLRLLEVSLGLAAVAVAGTLLWRHYHGAPNPAAPVITASSPSEPALLGPGIAPPPVSLVKAGDPPPAAQSTKPAADSPLLQAAAPLNEQMLRLTRLWLPGFRLGRGEAACRSLHRQRLECLKGNGQWQDLRGMDSPALLTLSLGRNNVRYVLLTGLGKDSATLLGPNGKQSLPLAALNKTWTGEYLVLWKRETDEITIGPDTRGEPIEWLRARLGQRLGSPIGSADPSRWDTELKQALQRYQGQIGLRPDGIAKGRTLMALASSHGPSLRGSP